MRNLNSTQRSRCKYPMPAPLLDWQRNRELLSIPAVRTIVSRARVSPVVAFAIAELSGLLNGSSHG